MPDGVFTNEHQGSYKDTISRIRFFEESSHEYRQVILSDDIPVALPPDLVSKPELAILIEYSRYPRVLTALRKDCPKAFIAVRSHNIEFLQHLDNHGLWPRRGPLWLIYGMARLFYSDIVSKRYANAIYSISDWENRVYWKHLPGKAAIEWLPYHCPDHLLPTHGRPAVERRIIACLPTSQKNRKSWDLVRRFYALAEQAPAGVREKYEFVVTGQLDDWGLPGSSSVRRAGMVPDLRSFLRSVNAICLLSPLGYGFKTTLADAVANGCHVLAHPTLVKRSPEIYRSVLIAADTADPRSLPRAFDRVAAPFPDSPIDADLRAVSRGILERDFVASGQQGGPS